MKVITSTTIDSELKRAAKRAGLNLSQLLEQAIRNRIAVRNSASTELDREEIELKLRKRQEELEKTSAEIEEYEEKLEVISQEEENLIQQDIQRQKEQQLKNKSCVECGSIHGEGYKWKIIYGKQVCAACYENKGVELFKKYKPKEGGEE